MFQSNQASQAGGNGRLRGRNESERNPSRYPNPILQIPAELSQHRVGRTIHSAGIFLQQDTEEDEDDSQFSLPIPTRQIMEQRWKFRRTIIKSTEQQRRIHPHGGIADTARNILHTLYDRERYSSRKLVLKYSSPSTLFNDDNGRSTGDKSPSTVFESPVSTTQTNLDEISKYHPKNITGNDQPIQTGTSTTDNDTTSSNVDTDTTPTTAITPSTPLAALTAINSASTSSIATTKNVSTLQDHRGVTAETHSSTTNDEDDNNTVTKTPKRVSYPLSLWHEIQTFAEYCSVTKYHTAFLSHLGGNDPMDEAGNRPGSSPAISTISVAFAPDGQTMASTHGDHTVKISSCSTGRLLKSLEGHPRTPWTVKYHPTDQRIIASGCLGQQVRVWNWTTAECLQMVRLEFAIISLSFHPSGTLLAVANGTRLHFWGIDQQPADDKKHNSASKNTASRNIRSSTQQLQSNSSNPQQQFSASSSRSGLLIEMDQRHMLRCVHFPPGGSTIIVGGVNPSTDDPRRRTRGGSGGIGGNGGMSFYLRLWDFDLQAALQPYNEMNVGIGIAIGRRAITNPRTFVPRALLYNDGGFDVSPDGKTLCACAEYWLPEGVDNAMELLHSAEVDYQESEARLDGSQPTASSDPPPPVPHHHTQLRQHFHHPQQQPPHHPNSLHYHNQHQHMSASASAIAAETHSAVTAALLRLKGITATRDATGRLILPSRGRSPSFRDAMPPNRSPPLREELSRYSTLTLPRTPTANLTSTSNSAFMSVPSNSIGSGASNANPSEFVPRTPPIPPEQALRLSPPSPPGRRPGRETVHTSGGDLVPDTNTASSGTASGSSSGTGGSGSRSSSTGSHGVGSTPGRGLSTPPPPPPPPPPPAPGGIASRPPHPLSVIASMSNYPDVVHRTGRFVPHVVTVSLDTSPIPTEIDSRLPRGKPLGAVARGYRPRLGQLLEACPLDVAKASAVTCVKFSPSTDFCLIGYGVRETTSSLDSHRQTSQQQQPHRHPVTALYRIRGGMKHVSTMLSGDDDVNIARFHPDAGYGFVYGTKQGRVRVLSPRPWNFYNC